MTFSEPVQGVDASDLVLSSAAAAAASVGTPSNPSGNTWRFPISGLTSGTLNLSLAPEAGDIEDIAGNDLANSTWSYTASLLAAPAVDPEPPTTPGESNTITWAAVVGADEYYVEYDDNSDFGSPTGNSGWIAGTQHTFSGLTPGVTYYYRVKARDRSTGAMGTWTQNTQAEFNTGTLTNTTATAAGDVELTRGTGGEITGRISNPSFETSGGWTYYESNSGYWYYLPDTTPDWCTDGSSSLYAYNSWLDSFAQGDYLMLTQSVDLTGVGTIEFDMKLDTSGVAAGIFKVSVRIDGTEKWSKTAYGVYLNQSIDVSGLSGTHTLEIRQEAVSAYGGGECVWSWWDDFRTYSTSTSGYATSGNIVSTALTRDASDTWGTVSFTKSTPTSTTLTVDVLPATGSTPITGYTNVTSGASLSGITDTTIRLRANLATSDTEVTPALHDWTVSWQEPDNYVFSGWSNTVFSQQVLEGSAKPTGIDLSAASDSGFSSADNITNLDNSAPGSALQFSITGTVVGATVTVYASGTAIGSAVAGGTTTEVTTNGSLDLPDGTYAVTTRQTEPGKNESSDSLTLAVTIDTTSPAVSERIPPAGSTVGTTTLNVDVVFSETVSGVEAADLVLSGTAGGTLGTPILVGANTYRFPIAGLTRGTLQLSLAPTVGNILDLAGNPLAGVVWSYIVDPNLQFVDDGDAGFQATAGWTHLVQTGAGFGDDVHTSLPGDGTSPASWTFSLAQGHYQVAVTWTASADRASDATFTLWDNDQVLVAQRVNQRLTPNDFTDPVYGGSWEVLDTVTVNSGTLVVRLTDAANGIVVADAVRVRRVVAGFGEPPAIGSLAASLAATAQGDQLTLTCSDVTDPDGDVTRVVFWRDRNGNGVVDGQDIQLGIDHDDNDGWSLTIPAAGLPLGTNKFLAVAVDSGGRGWLSSDLLGAAAGLGQLAGNRGPTGTHRLLPGSPAIDAGTDLDAPGADQRGIARPQDGGSGFALVDIGAVERFYGEVHGVRFHDLNGNGVRDPGEPGLANLLIFLDLNRNERLDPGEPTTLTQEDSTSTPDYNESGTYSFTGVPAGAYTVAEVFETGWGWEQTFVHYGLGIERVTLGTERAEANATSRMPSISADGRFVAFASEASDLVPDDSNAASDVFVYDVLSGEIERVSLASGGGQGNADSLAPSLSADGRYVAFESLASNLAPGDTNDSFDVFVYDRYTKIVERMSVNSQGVQASGDSRAPSISAGGRYVAFESAASNLVAGDGNQAWDVFVADRLTDAVARASDASPGVAANADSRRPAISADGLFVAFQSLASNLVPADTNAVQDIFVYNRQTAAVERVSRAVTGEQGNDSSREPSISGDGRYVAFASYASSLVPGDTSSLVEDIFVFDRSAGEIQRVNLAAGGVEANASSAAAAISADGRYAAFESSASNLVPNDTNGRADIFVVELATGALQRASVDTLGVQGNSDSYRPALSGDGGRVAFYSFASNFVPDDTRAVGDVFVADLAGGAIDCASTVWVRTEANGDSYSASPSSDGRYVAFESNASNLVPDDTNAWIDVFVIDRLTDAIERVSLANDGVQANEDSRFPAISADGRYVAFQSRATNLVPGVTNSSSDIFVYDRLADTIECVSVRGGQEGNGDSSAPSISDDGRYVAFRSEATNLVEGDTNGRADVFAFDRLTRRIQRVHVSSSGGQANGDAGTPAISGNGRYVAFLSDAADLVAGDSNQRADVFVYDRQTRTVERQSLAADGSSSNGASAGPVLSANGLYVVFVSEASNLVPGDLHGEKDVFAAATVATRRPQSRTILLAPGEKVAGIDWGNQPRKGEIHRRKFHDLDRDGYKDATEPGLDGWTVYLDLNGNGTLDGADVWTRSDALGEYAFTGLTPFQTYTVAELPRDFWLQTAPRLAEGGRAAVYVDAGQIVTGIDFGNYYRGPGGVNLDVVSGRLFADLNGNAFQDAGELGLAGWTVYLDLNENGVPDQHGGVDEPIVLTAADDPATPAIDESGLYAFEGLQPGHAYSVRVALPVDWQQTTPLDSRLTGVEYGADRLDHAQAVAAGDFDGDGNPDLAVAHGNYTALLINHGDGSFAAPADIPAYNAIGAWSVVAGHFNADEHLDLAVTNYWSSTVSILLNQGGAVFALQENVAVGVYPHAIAAGDFDRDGDVDLAVTLEHDGKLAILRNNGQGSFTVDLERPLADVSPFSVIAGQFNDDNGDGSINDLDALDLAVANFGNPLDDFTNGNVTVLLNNGSGRFVTRFDIPAGNSPTSVTAADFDRDGDQDLAVTNFQSDDISLVVNVGNGSFASQPATLPAGTGPYAVTAADLDNDGDADLVVTNGTDEHLAILRNESKPGQIAFAMAQGFAVANFSTSLSFAVTAADLDRDGTLDLAVSNGSSQSVSVLLNEVVQGSHRVSVSGVTAISDLNFGVLPADTPPTISQIPDQTTPEGRTLGPLAVTVGDLETPAAQLVVSVTSDNPTLLPANSIVLGGTGTERTLSLTPAAQRTGTAWITVKVSDGIVTVSEIFQVTVTPMMALASFEDTSTGFVARFNHDLDVSVLNLYDQGHALGPADVTVVGASAGYVRGSLVVAPDLRSVTFIKTGGVLDPDTYTVRLFSGADAFRDTVGNWLDGNGDGTAGDDYQTSFQVADAPANRVTVSLSDFTRGYGQSVNLPADNLTAGIPLQLSEGLGVSRLELTLHYNPNLLEFQTFAPSESLVQRGGHAEFVIAPLGTGTLQITAPVSFGQEPGPLSVGKFVAAVPATAPYAGKHVLEITNLHVYDDADEPVELPAVDDDAIHVAAFFGDNNGSRSYNAPDVTLNQRLIGLINTGLGAYQLADPLLLADITLNSRLQANDTVSIQRVIGQVPVANVPAQPAGLTPPAAAGADPKIYIPQDLSGSPGDSVAVPVRLQVTEAAGITLSGFDLAIEFDPARFTVRDAQLGNLFDTLDFVGLWTNPARGRLIYTASSASGTGRLVANTEGSLVVLTLTIESAAAGGSSALNLLASFQTTATAAFDDELNALVLTPAPTNAADDSVDGLLTVRSSPPARPPAQNAVQPLDTNEDGEVTPADALAVINYLNAGLPQDAAVLYVLPGRPAIYADVNGDRRITAQDVLEVVNQLNGQWTPGGEGEARKAALSALLDEEGENGSLWELLAEDRLRP